MTPVSLWCVVPADGDCREVFGQPVPAFVEWMRLLVGRSLSCAQPVGGGARFEFLVTGVAVEDFERLQDPAVYDRAVRAIDADLAILQRSIEVHREILKKAAPKDRDAWMGFLSAYGVLARLSLPTNLDHWRVTDEGVSIVQWGLAGDGQKFLLEWTPEELRRCREQLKDRVLLRKPKDAIVGADAAGMREARIESNAQESNIKKSIASATTRGGARQTASPSDGRTESAGAVPAQPASASAPDSMRERLLARLRAFLADRAVAALLFGGALVLFVAALLVGVIVGRATRSPVIEAESSEPSGRSDRNSDGGDNPREGVGRRTDSDPGASDSSGRPASALDRDTGLTIEAPQPGRGGVPDPGAEPPDSSAIPAATDDPGGSTDPTPEPDASGTLVTPNSATDFYCEVIK